MSMEYKPLNSSKDEIRLLRRLPSPDNILHFSLEKFPLSTAPPFWAFSYVWGDPKVTSRIVVNNHNFEATENLVAALTTHVNDILGLRAEVPNHLHLQAEYLWADAICINQRNQRERTEQVLHMYEIYRKGIVCIYLNTVNREAYASVYKVLRPASKASDGKSSPTIPDNAWPDLVQFFSKDWFHRMWMIQEFIIPDTSPLMFFLGGHKGIEELELRDAAWRIFQQRSRHLTVQEEFTLLSGVKQYMSLAEIKDRIKDGRQCSFLTLLWIFRDRLVSDPRDKIYSLLGLLHLERADDRADTPFTASYDRGLATKELLIDYEATVEDVYASVVKAVVLGTQSLNILCACQRSRQFVRSWVPDWTEHWSRVSLFTNSTDIAPDYMRKTNFKASAGQVSTAEFAQNLHSIAVVGTRNSIVSALSTQPPGQLDSDWVLDWFNNVDHRLRSRIRTMYKEDYSNGLDPFVLSLCAVNTEEDGFHFAEALAGDYILPYTGASAEWKEMVQFYNERTTDRVETQDLVIDIRIAQMLDGRRAFIGNNGHCGLVPDQTETGDLICVLFGCDVPVVLRQKAGHYIFIGECYVRGLMHGEAVETLKQGNAEEERFEIF